MLINLHDLCDKYNFRPKGVIHVGAHTAEEQYIYNAVGVRKVIWIEAIPHLVERLREKFNHNPNVMILHGVVSDRIENIKFQVTNNLASSSILKLGKHKERHPKIYVTHELEVTTVPLDILLMDINLVEYDFLNLDIQGAELKALKGFKMEYIKYVYTEVNIDEVYEGCSLISELDEYLKDFERVETKITKYNWGDAFYVKKINNN